MATTATALPSWLSPVCARQTTGLLELRHQKKDRYRITSRLETSSRNNLWICRAAYSHRVVHTAYCRCAALTACRTPAIPTGGLEGPAWRAHSYAIIIHQYLSSGPTLIDSPCGAGVAVGFMTSRMVMQDYCPVVTTGEGKGLHQMMCKPKPRHLEVMRAQHVGREYSDSLMPVPLALHLPAVRYAVVRG